MTDRRLLITGGSGFIGAQSVQAALACGFSVRSLDLAPPVIAGHETLFQRVDVRDREAVCRAVEAFSPTHILHLASDIDITISRLEDFVTTIGGTANIIEAARRLPTLKRVIHVSTQFVCKPGKQPKSETDYDPYTLYGVAKAESERLFQASGLPFLITRPTIIWGPRHPSFAQHIWRYIANGAYLHPVGLNPIMRCYGYVDNVAAQSIALLDGDPGARRVFYLGDDTIDYDMWADAFAVPLTGRRARRIPMPLLAVVAAGGSALQSVGMHSPIDLGRYHRMTTSSAIDLSPTFAIVGQPKVDFDTGVRETLKWLVETVPETYRMVGPAAAAASLQTKFMASTPAELGGPGPSAPPPA